MIAILFPVPHIKAGSLQMTIRDWTYPYACPGRRYGQATNTPDLFLVVKEPAIVQIGKPFSLFQATNPWLFVRYIDEVSDRSCFFIVPVYFQKLTVRYLHGRHNYFFNLRGWLFLLDSWIMLASSSEWEVWISSSFSARLLNFL